MPQRVESPVPISGQFYEMLHAILDATSDSQGETFVRRLVQTLSSKLNIHYVYIAECIDDRRTSVRTLAFWMGSAFGDNFEYSVAHTPCEDVMQGHLRHYADGIRQLFPRDEILQNLDAESYVGVPMTLSSGQLLGHLVIMDKHPIPQSLEVHWLLRICAYRAQTEIERFRTEAELLRQQSELKRITEFVKKFNSRLGLEELLQTILDETKALSGASKATAVLLDPLASYYRLYASTDDDLHEKNIRLTTDDLVARYFRNSEEVSPDLFLIRDVRGRPAEDKLQGIPLPFRMLVIRINVNDRIAGALIFDSFDPNFEFSKEHQAMLAGLKEAITAAVIKARILDDLQRLYHQKNEFLGMAAHDLRNPLQAVSGYVDIMLESLINEKVDRELMIQDLTTVRESVRRMSDLICKLLHIAAMESGSVPLNIGTVDLARLIRQSQETYKPIAAKKSIRLVVETCPDLPEISADACAIGEVLDNLIGNAIKFTYPGGRVVVTCSVGPSDVTVSVADTGQGLTSEDMKQLFTSFRRLSSKPTAGESSTGLGLVIVKKIVEHHGGKLHVESRKGEGATFTFSLPTSR